jgi:hypothetical protein
MSSVDLKVIMVCLLYVGHKKARDVAGVTVDWMIGSGGAANGRYGFFI